MYVHIRTSVIPNIDVSAHPLALSCPSFQALCRFGLLTVNLDSPMHSSWTNQKYHNAKTERACQACRVTKKDLGNPRYNIVTNARSADGLKRDLDRVAKAEKQSERTRLSKSLGVVLPQFPNPVDLVTFDKVEQCGMEVLHQVKRIVSGMAGLSFDMHQAGIVCSCVQLKSVACALHRRYWEVSFLLISK